MKNRLRIFSLLSAAFEWGGCILLIILYPILIGVGECTPQSDKINTATSGTQEEIRPAEASQKLELTLEPSSSAQQWETAYRAIENCAQVDLTVWYAFGSLTLKTQPAGSQCRMQIFIEGELSETHQQKVFTCVGDPSVFRTLDLVHDGESLRDGPPLELPEALKTFCQSVMPD